VRAVLGGALFVGLSAVPVAAATTANTTPITTIETLAGANAEATGVSCPPHSPCVAVDYTGSVYLLSGSRGIKVAAVRDPLFGVSCPSVSFCAADSESGMVVLFGSKIGFYPIYDSTTQSDIHWQSVSCSSSTFCMAGGGVVIGPDKGAGVISRWNGLVWSAIQVADPKVGAPNNQISTMTCPKPTFCVAADQYEHTLQWNGTKWFFPARLNAPYTNNSFSVSCTSSSYCLAVGAVGNATVTWNGKRWEYQIVEPNFTLPPNSSSYAFFATVSCTAPTYCLAIDQYGDASFWNGDYWSLVEASNPGPNDFAFGVACSSGWFCEAVTASDHYVYIHNRAHPPKLPFLCSEFACAGQRV
jgi:hypothetical protein